MRKFDEQSAFELLAWLMRHARSESVRLGAIRQYLRFHMAYSNQVKADLERRLLATNEKATAVRHPCDHTDTELRELSTLRTFARARA